MNTELVALSPDEIIESGVSQFNENGLPEKIAEQISKLKELDESVKKAISAAEKAKNSADKANNARAGFFRNTAAIEVLQTAGLDVAEAIESEAEALKISFEFQTKLADVSKGLFRLGISNIASNRFVVREIEMRLKGASQEELSELARQELMAVVKQLKEQEDILRKQEVFSKTLKIHDERLKAQSQKSQQIDEKLQAQSDVNKLHEDQLIIQAENDKMLGEKLQVQVEIDEQHDEQLAALREKNNNLTEQIESNLKAIEAQEIKINFLKDEVANLNELLNSKANNSFSNIILAIAIIAFATSIVHFFI